MDILTIDQCALIITSLDWLMVVQPTPTCCLLGASDQVPLRHHVILRSGVAAASSGGTFSGDDHLLRRLLLLLQRLPAEVARVLGLVVDIFVCGGGDSDLLRRRVLLMLGLSLLLLSGAPALADAG